MQPGDLRGLPACHGSVFRRESTWRAPRRTLSISGQRGNGSSAAPASRPRVVAGAIRNGPFCRDPGGAPFWTSWNLSCVLLSERVARWQDANVCIAKGAVDRAAGFCVAVIGPKKDAEKEGRRE